MIYTFPPTSIGVSGLADLGDFDGFDEVAALVETGTLGTLGHIRPTSEGKNHDDTIMNIRKQETRTEFWIEKKLREIKLRLQIVAYESFEES